MTNASCTLPVTIPGISFGTAIPSLYMIIPGFTLSAAACSSRLEEPLVSSTTPSALVSRSRSSIPFNWSSLRVPSSQGLNEMKYFLPDLCTKSTCFLSSANPPGKSRYISHWFRWSSPSLGQVGHRVNMSYPPVSESYSDRF